MAPIIAFLLILSTPYGCSLIVSLLFLVLGSRSALAIYGVFVVELSLALAALRFFLKAWVSFFRRFINRYLSKDL